MIYSLCVYPPIFGLSKIHGGKANTLPTNQATVSIVWKSGSVALRLMVSEADCTYVHPRGPNQIEVWAWSFTDVLGQLWGAFNGKNPLPAVAIST